MDHSDKRKTPLTYITEKDIETKLTQEYRLVPKKIEKFTGGTESIAWLIKTNKGNFVAKVFGGKLDTIQRVTNETTLYNYLNVNGKRYDLEVPTVIPNSHHQFTSTLTNHPFILMKYMNLRRLYPSTITQKEISLISTAIAHLHHLLQKYTEESPKTPHYSTWNLDYNHSAYTALEKSPNSKIYSVNEMTIFQKITEAAASLLQKTPYPKKLQESYLHGDIGLEHAQLLPSGFVYFFDWSDRVRGPVSRELSILLSHSYREQAISFTRWQQLRDWILQSYSQVNQLKSNDINALTPFILRRCLDEIRYLADLAIQNNTPVEVKAIARRFDLAKKLI